MPSRQALFELLRHGSAERQDPAHCTVNFLVCTDQPAEVAFLDYIDALCPFVDVTDDYATERDQVAAAKTRTFRRPLSTADWVVKAQPTLRWTRSTNLCRAARASIL